MNKELDALIGAEITAIEYTGSSLEIKLNNGDTLYLSDYPEMYLTVTNENKVEYITL